MVILFLDSEKKLPQMLTNSWKCVLTFVNIALPAYKKKQGNKALKGSGSKLGPMLAWALWCFEESVNLMQN